MKIYNADGTEFLDVQVDDNSYRYREIKGDHNLTLYFSLAQHTEIPVGAYCVYENETYTLEKSENLKMNNSRNFEYTVIFDSPKAKLSKYKFRNTVDRRLKFNLTAQPQEHLQMLIDNLNSRESGWEIGECISGTEKLISYNHAYCIDALSQMSDEFETEWEIVGKAISLHKVEYNKDNPLALSYGKGNGFIKGVGRTVNSDSAPVEILYTQGGEDNIDASKYGSKELLLPKSQSIKYDGEYFEDETGFNATNARSYITDADGFSIRRSDKALSSQAESSLDCSEIYPKRIGTISDVVIEDADNNFYDIVDNEIPDALNYEDYLIEGETMTIIFQSGMLAGKEFDVKYIHNIVGSKQARRFEIVPQEIDGQTMPGGSYLPIVGDTYAVFHCMLPDAYICDNTTKSGASWDMFRAGVKYLYDNEEQKFSFTGELDGIWAKKDWVNIGGKIKLGGYISFSDTRFQPDGVLIRIINIKDYVNNPYSPEIELDNSTAGSSITSSLRQIKNNEVLTDSLHKEAIRFTKRRFRDSQETIEMLGDALLDNFTNSINPISVQTMAILLGDESLQFYFVDNTTDPVEIEYNAVFNQDTKILSLPAGIIQHMTLGIDSISSSHSADEYKYWTMSAFESPALTDTEAKYYIYAKVSKTEETGTFLMSETAIAFESVSGYYHLFFGVLNSEYDGERSLVPLYGYTEILPGRITTKKIVSPSGNLSISLEDDTASVQGKIIVTDGSSGYANLTDKPDLSVYAKSTVVTSLQTDLQNQIDGQIESWFQEYDPTTSNFPASDWLTDALKQQHANDTFTNTLTGGCWRWQQVSGSWSWGVISDTATQQALTVAAAAQEAADDAYSEMPGDDTLVAQYSFDETGTDTIHDSSINQHNVTNPGNSFVAGKVGKAINFTGTSGMGLDLGVFSIGTTESSYSFWLYVASAPTSWKCIIGHDGNGTSSGDYFSVWLDSNGRLRCFVGDGTTYMDTLVNSSDFVGGWHHVVFTFKSGEALKCYLDGVLKASSSIILTTSLPTDKHIGIGYSYYASSYYFTGYLDDLRIYSKALSLDEVKALYRYSTSDAAAAALTAQNTIDKMQIGGRNYFLDSKSKSLSAAAWTLSSQALSNFGLSSGDYLTVKFDIISNTTFNLRLYLAPNTYVTWNSTMKSVGSSSGYTITTTKQTICVTFQYQGDGWPYFLIYKNYNSITSDTVSRLKLEKGNKATDWTLAWEDVAASIADAATKADWTYLSNIPVRYSTPSSTPGLFCDSTHMGYFDGSGWNTYMDSAGNFALGSQDGVNPGMYWNQRTGELNIWGQINASRGDIAGWAAEASQFSKSSGNNEMIISSADMSIIFNYSNTLRLSISGNVIPAIATLLMTNPSSASLTGSLATSGNGTSQTFYSSTFSLTSQAVITLTSTFSYSNNAASPCIHISGTIYLCNSSGNVLDTIGSFDKTGDTNTYSTTFNVSKTTTSTGTVRFKYVYSVTDSSRDANDLNNVPGTATVSATTVSISYSSTATYLGRDGLASYWGSSKYFYLSSTDSSYLLQMKGNINLAAPSGNAYMRITDALAHIGYNSSRYLEMTSSQIILKGIPSGSDESGDWGYVKVQPSTGKLYYHT